MMKTQPKASAFDGLGDLLGSGVESLFTDGPPPFSMVFLDQIQVGSQIRSVFEDDDNRLEELACDIKKRGVIQPILIRPVGDGYSLVAGERRFRASQMAGLEQIPAFIRELTDEEAEDAQLAENIHRMNLSLLEEARKVKKDLDKLGNIEAVLEKHNKSRAWLSKRLNLLDLPAQANRLISEDITADTEVILSVRTIEQLAPEKAAAVVDALKQGRGIVNARDLVNAAKKEAKPKARNKSTETQKPASEESGPSEEIFAGAKKASKKDEKRLTSDVLNALYDRVQGGDSVQVAINGLDDASHDAALAWLRQAHANGGQLSSNDVGIEILSGLRDGRFTAAGQGALTLLAFLQGRQGEAFNLSSLLEKAKRA